MPDVTALELQKPPPLVLFDPILLPDYRLAVLCPPSLMTEEEKELEISIILWDPIVVAHAGAEGLLVPDLIEQKESE